MCLGGSLYVSGLSGKRNQRRGLGWEGERDEEEKKKSRRREETGEEDKMKGAGGNVKIDTTVKGRGGKRDGRREGVESAFTATSTTLVSNLSLDPLLPTLMTYPAAST